MIKATSKLIRGINGMPWPWRLWVLLLGAANVFGVLFLGRPEAHLVLVTFAVAALAMTVLTAVVGFTRLLGLAHFVWFPLLAYLWTRLDTIPAETTYGIWIRVLMVVNGASLLIDVADVVRYIMGERAELADAR